MLQSVHQLTFIWRAGEISNGQVSACPVQNTKAPLLPFHYPLYGSQIFLIDYTHPYTTLLHSLLPCPWSEQSRMAVGGPWESGLGWGPLTNTQPNVLIDPMPSYFRTSVRRQGVARRDQQSAALKELEQGGGGGGVDWRRGQRWVHSTPPRRSTRRQGTQVQLCNTELWDHGGRSADAL